MTKKIVSAALAVILLATLMLPVSAQSYTLRNDEVPVIMIGGDGEPIVDAEGNQVIDVAHLSAVTADVEKKDVYESVANILKPFLLEGIFLNRWDKYYENLYTEISEMTQPFRLDKDGNATNGTNISAARIAENERSMHADKKGEKGYYSYNDYLFWYDWRLDPLETADRLAEYIDNVLAATGKEKVAIIARCVGTNIALAYVAKYGTAKLYGLGFDGSCSCGGEFISDALSGKFHVDGNAIERFLTDYDAMGLMNVSEFAIASVDLLTKSGVLDAFLKVSRATIYKKIAEGATSALALSTMLTMPCYWCFVTAEDYETAKNYIFGEEGSAKRAEYAVLIEKLDRYQDTVRTKIPELMQSLKDNGVNVGVFSKYGYQIVPICASCDAVADTYASVHSSSFGATTSTVYDTLSDDYIAARVAEGKGKYISPDKKVDASTCIFPDNTWFSKGARHGDWTKTENELLYAVVTADRQLTTEDFDYTQFMVYNTQTREMSPMTTENCNTEYWTADQETDAPTNVFLRIRAYLKALVNWIKALGTRLRTKHEK